MKEDSAQEKSLSKPDSVAGGDCAGPTGSTFVEAAVTMIHEEYGHRVKIDWRTGEVCDRTYTGGTTRSMSAQDLMSGRMIENLPAALDCKLGDIVRITVEVIKPNSDYPTIC